MSTSCPGPCGRLATAAIFISVAVVQTIAGMILLKSKYAYMLSAPNFWTAASNLAVGCLLGVSVNVWTDTTKKTNKHSIRRKVLSALAGSALTLNAVTAAIFIMGEGDTLLSIQLENNGKRSSATLASEILAYAYATSVCSPIICIVVSIAYLSGMCFQKGVKDLKLSEIKNILKKEKSYSFDWVYEKTQDIGRKLDQRNVQKALLSKLSPINYNSPVSLKTVERRDFIAPNALLNLSLIRERERQDGYRTVQPLPTYYSEADRENISQLSNVSFNDSLYSPSCQILTNTAGDVDRTVCELPLYVKSEKSKDGASYSETAKYKRKRKRMFYKDYRAFRDEKAWTHQDEIVSDLDISIHSHSSLQRSFNQDISNLSETSFRVDAEESEVCSHEISLVYDTVLSSDLCEATEEEFGGHSKIRRSSTSNDLTLLNSSTANVGNIFNYSIIDEASPSASFESSANSRKSKTIAKLNKHGIQGPFQKPPDLEVVKAAAFERTTENLAGEVVAVQLNRSPSEKLNSKLVPVSVNILGKNTSSAVNKGKGFRQTMKKVKDFDRTRAVSFSSFHKEIKTDNRNKRPRSTNGNRDLNLHIDESSPQTSGYSSALEESLIDASKQREISNSSSSGNNLAVTAPPSVIANQEREYSIPEKLQDSKSILNNTNTNMDKTLISELLKDALFQKVLKETVDDANV